MGIRTILAPGVEIKEYDKSGYSPAMTGTNCFVMGFTDKGEPYQPMEFTSRAAWVNYYGEPDNEAERYAYSAACEVLNQNGRLYFARLPYDNMAFEKIVGFKYTLRTDKTLSLTTPFHEIYKEDSTVDNATAIEPSATPTLYDLSAIEEYRTDEAKVANNTFLIVDTAFNTYGKIPEDYRKNERREMIGIMPVITTAANAMYAQSLISVDKESVIGYETVGTIKTLNAAATVVEQYGSKYVYLSSQEVLPSDMAKLINTKDYYHEIGTIDIRVNASISVSTTASDSEIKTAIDQYLVDDDNKYVYGSWDGQYQVDDSLTAYYTASFSYVRSCSKAECQNPAEYYLEDTLTSYVSQFGWHNLDGDDAVPETVSLEANSYFPAITTVQDNNGNTRFDRDNLKKIGVVVYKMFLDPASGNKINFEPVESFAGSLCKTDKDPNTGATTFIDTIINSQSQYINFFSNCFNTSAGKKYYNNSLDIFVVQPGASHYTESEDVILKTIEDYKTLSMELSEKLGFVYTINNIDDLDTVIKTLSERSNVQVEDLTTLRGYRSKLNELYQRLTKISTPADTICPSLGFYSEMTKEDISISKSIYDGMNKCFDKVADVNERDIDIVPDAGLANIASYLKAIFGEKGQYDLQITDDVGNSLLGMWKCDKNNSAVKTWRVVEQKFDTFCKSTRKDCMFIADGPRPLVLSGQKKIIRPSKPANTIDANIVPNLKWITGLNTSYGAMYVDWFEQADDYSGDFFWCPPSIKAMGVYINTDVNFNYWDAPAGLNRGVIQATDVAFSPTMKQAGCFYEKNLNYAINYPQDGIVLEGQKTLQVKPSAFDRVNVRRLFLRLERMSYKVARYFVYEGNTAYTRQRLVDALDPYFKEAKLGGGIYEYKIKCDEDNNTPTTIDRNELHCAIGIKPVKAAEFIMLDFIALSTGGSWSEAGF